MSQVPRLHRLRRRAASALVVVLAAAALPPSPAGATSRPVSDDVVDQVAIFGNERSEAFTRLFAEMHVESDRFPVAALATTDLDRYGAVVVTSETYPATTQLSDAAVDRVDTFVSGGRTAYVEYATGAGDLLPATGAAANGAQFERIVAAGDDPATKALAPLTVLEEHLSHYLPVQLPSGASTPLVYAKVAGVYDAVFGLPERTAPALSRIPRGDGSLVYASTALSNFDRGNYGLRAEWRQLVHDLLVSVLPPASQQAVRANEIPLEAWTSPREWVDPADPAKLVVRSAPGRTVTATLDGRQLPMRETAPGRYESTAAQLRKGDHRYRITAGEDSWARTTSVSLEALPRREKYRRMVDRTMQWYDRAGMLYYRDGGEGGVAEGLVSELQTDGTHRFRERTRGDSFVQSAYAFQLYGALTGEKRYGRTANNLMDLVLDRMLLRENNYLYGSWSTRGYDTKEHGDLGWLYPDDQGWLSLMSLAWFAQNDKTSTLQDGLRGVEALVRTANADTGLYAIKRPGYKDLLARGWQGTAAIPDQDGIALDPHWQSQPQAAMLYAYALTGDDRYLTAATKGLDRMIAEYPAVGIETSRTAASARYLLPLAAAYRYTKEPRYKATMLEIADYLREHQDPETGAIPELDGRNPTSNDAYGTGENSIFQENGDPVTDQLYSLGLLSMNLQLAYEATKDPTFRGIQEKLLDYLARIQIESSQDSLDGTWMRAFDYKNWEYYGSSADRGWGPYSVQVGWTNAPIAIGALLYLTDKRFFPAEGTDRTDVADSVSAEFDQIENGSGTPPSAPERAVEAPAPWHSDLVGAWDFEEPTGYRAGDSSGRNNHGVLIGATRSAGKSGRGITLDGVDDYVNLTNQTGKDLDGAPGVTVAAWVKLDVTKPGWQRLFVSRITNRRGGIDVSVDNSGATPRIAVGARTDYPGEALSQVFGAWSIQPGRWHHVAVTIDFAGNDIRAYVDGYALAQTSATGTAFDSTEYHWGDPAVADTLGRTPNGNEYLAAHLDSMRLLRGALSWPDVQRLMKDTAGK
ncbi:LamG-like jellyroll fold domain-containing protein [Micromonospora sp. NPDC005305]|uniref:LamG-like jellyroll fold domain-containing protein n=1 Tax=Micromonospora sp. NPDC005305 TaxID=3156875 RepID=UPI0033AE3B9E